MNGALLGYAPQVVGEVRKFELENVTILLHEMEELRAEGRLVILSIVPKSRVKVSVQKIDNLRICVKYKHELPSIILKNLFYSL